MVIVGDCERFLYGTGPGEFRWSLNYQTKYGGPFGYDSQDATVEYDDSVTVDVDNGYLRFVLDFGGTLRLEGLLQEIDGFGADGTLSWDTSYEAGVASTQSFIFSTDDPEDEYSNASWDVEGDIRVNP